MNIPENFEKVSEENLKLGKPLEMAQIITFFSGVQTSQVTAYTKKLRTNLHHANIDSP